ncbi:MAG TPA: ShlB/FhaC/HecB family hemolysin secretion/activation protein [Sphingomicrobium sp.]|nr:ShlB/FhaC/HecB family hemolysin secretion/activation protein [Sphingomicrobium sp.]
MRSRRRGFAHLLGSAILLALPASAVAQTAPPPQPLPLPPTREEVTRPPAPSPVPGASKLEVEGGVERSPCALDGPEYQSIHFVLRGAEFDGLKGLTAEQLASAYAPYVGRDVPISVVCEIRDRAGTILRDAGYIAAVQVPEQKIADGTLRFRVLMAHLTQVRVRGNATGAEQIIAGYLNQLTKQPVFNRFEAERYLLLASDLPGYTVRLTLRPAGTEPGDVLGDVTVQRTPAYVDFNVQNGGSEALGPWGGLLRGEVFGLTGLGDRTVLSVFSTADFHEQQTVQIGHDFRLGPQGLSIGDNFTYAWAKPTVPDSRVLARTLLNTFEIGYPIVRRQAQTVRASAGMDYVNQDVKLDGIKLTRDRLRVGFLRLGFDATPSDSGSEPPWRVANQVELRKGLHVFGATDDCGPLGAKCLGPGEVPPSRIEGQSDAAVLRYTGYGEFRPIPKLTLALGARVQYAWKPLLSFEEFSAGNYTVGRGYDPGALLGDKGFGTQAEIRVGSRVPSRAKRPAVEGYAFWDHASVGNHDKLFVVRQSDHLNSVGAGARINFDRFALDAALAVPLTRVGIENIRPDPRFLVSLTTRLWPWSNR